MSGEPYQAWISLYSNEVRAKWDEERKELRKISMLYTAFQNELNNIKKSLDQELSEVRLTFKQRDDLEKCKMFLGLVQSDAATAIDKENKSPEVPLRELNLNNETRTQDFFIETPNTSSFFKEKSLSPQRKQNRTLTSPILNKNSFTKRKKSASPTCLAPVTHKIEKAPPIPKSTATRTPNNCDDSNIMESSVVEDTPELKPSKRTKSSMRLRVTNTKKPKFNHSKQKSTLTQMFWEPKKPKKDIDSNMASMNISEMIDLINESSSDSETDAELDQSDDATVDNLSPEDENPKPDENLESFVKNYDKIPEKKTDVPKFAFKEVVRGNARKNLKGWSCQECKDYYEALNLPPDEIQRKKNECSKHRSNFKPREETYDGFWDLTFGPTPKTRSQDTEESIVFHYKK